MRLSTYVNQKFVEKAEIKTKGKQIRSVRWEKNYINGNKKPTFLYM